MSVGLLIRVVRTIPMHPQNAGRARDVYPGTVFVRRKNPSPGVGGNLTEETASMTCEIIWSLARLTFQPVYQDLACEPGLIRSTPAS